MRKVRFIMLLAALICTGVACKKDGSSLTKEPDLNNVSETLSAVSGIQQEQVAAEFERATGLEIVDQVPINPDNRIVLNSSEEAVEYFSALISGNTAPVSLETVPANLPVPEDQNCYTCKNVKVIATIPFHASILIGVLQFKRLTTDLQYSFVNDFWTLTGAHFGLASLRPIAVNMMSTTKFTFEKAMEYYIGVRYKHFDFTVSFPFWISGNGDVMDQIIPGYVRFMWVR